MDEKVRLLDIQFSRFLARCAVLSEREKKEFQDVVCRLSAGISMGDSCLPLTKQEKLLVESSGLSGLDTYPLCVVGNHLYFQRYFKHEKRLAEIIKSFATARTAFHGDTTMLDDLFGRGKEKERDWQRVAAEQALVQNFLIISGGPGTGKTTTVVKVLALLQAVADSSLRIALAAPTGKAAMRLQESVGASVHRLPCDESILDTIPRQASTLHRLLGVRRHSPFFQHNGDNPLSYDVVVVDEASMVDLALMSKLVAALRPGSRLILLGDKNQLASVESGTVLADLISAMPGHTVELRKSYRFDTSIQRFAEAINAGNSDLAWDFLAQDEPQNVALLGGDVAEYGGEMYCSYMSAVREAKSLSDYKRLFPSLQSFKILCALRHGRAGVSGINERVERYLTSWGYDCLSTIWYGGRPVMITRNDYGLDLYNGDMGICLPDPENPEVMKVWFERSDGRLLGLLPGRISGCQTVYAMTIHKSQGTEIDEVLVVLPEKDSVLLTRELLYTAVTRAKQCVKIKGKRSVFSRAVKEKITRHSGLSSWLSGVVCDV